MKRINNFLLGHVFLFVFPAVLGYGLYLELGLNFGIASGFLLFILQLLLMVVIVINKKLDVLKDMIMLESELINKLLKDYFKK